MNPLNGTIKATFTTLQEKNIIIYSMTDSRYIIQTAQDTIQLNKQEFQRLVRLLAALD